jgi:uncharacterized alpha-E superfamily protein
MGRYVERAENTARILDINFRLLLDNETEEDDSAWAPLVNLVPQTRALFETLYPAATPEAVSRFMTFDEENPDSILSTIIMARENARSCRESVSSDMWEVLNTLYLSITGPGAQAAWTQSPYTFYRQIQHGSQHMQGTTDATLPHDDGWHFIQVGKFLERADSATRILDAKRALLVPSDEREGLDGTQLTAVLRSCSGYEAYRRQLHAHLTPKGVVRFLLLDPLFPRSVRFCIDGAWGALRALGAPASRQQANQAERAIGLLRAQLEFADIDEVLADLPAALDRMQRHINRVGEQVHRVYLYSHQRSAAGMTAQRAAQAITDQQQQQQ